MGGVSLIDDLRYFRAWPKTPRLRRDVVVTEKIDGTNAAVTLTPIAEVDELLRKELGFGMFHYKINPDDPRFPWFAEAGGFAIAAQSKWQFLRPGKRTDNHGFAAWVLDHSNDLARLGEGRHYGEWWGKGIQRGYGMDRKMFSLFNTERWGKPEERPVCCKVVPILYQGIFNEHAITACMTTLNQRGSLAAPGFRDPEGVVVYHTAARTGFKWTFVGDESGKEATSQEEAISA